MGSLLTGLNIASYGLFQPTNPVICSLWTRAENVSTTPPFRGGHAHMNGDLTWFPCTWVASGYATGEPFGLFWRTFPHSRNKRVNRVPSIRAALKAGGNRSVRMPLWTSVPKLRPNKMVIQIYWRARPTKVFRPLGTPTKVIELSVTRRPFRSFLGVLLGLEATFLNVQW